MKRLENPPNPYLSAHHEWLEPPPEVRVEVYEERARSIIAENDSPDIPFRYSVNAYRGCQHACGYCYARPYHEYLGFGAGTDFETRIVVKVNAAELLEREFRRPGWTGEGLAFSGVTDCYQPLEAVYGLTRECLRVCVRFRNPVHITTKAYLVMRDADLLAELARVAAARVMVTIPFRDVKDARLMEPGAPTPERRFDAMRRLAEAGVPVGIMVSPIIPGLNDRDIPELLARAAKCGATSAATTALRLPGSVEQVFLSRLQRDMPMRYQRIESRIREIRGGELSECRFGERMHGQGTYWDSIMQLFSVTAKRHGLAESEGDTAEACTFRLPPMPERAAERAAERPGAGEQMLLPFA